MKLELPHGPEICAVAIELSNECQNRCNKCWSQSPQLLPPRAKGFMSSELFYKVLDETVSILERAKRMDNAIVALSYGGESTLHPQFKEFAEAFGRTKIKRRQFVTNAILLDTPERRQVILDNFTELAISIHNQPSLPDVLRNLEAFKKQRGDLMPCFRANIVEEEFKTKYGLLKVVNQIKAMGVPVKLISALTEDISRYVDDVEMRPAMCFSPFWYMGILWNGDVLPCCHILSSGQLTLGNVTERTMQDVFDDKPYAALRAGFYEGTPCERCTIRM